MRIQLFQKISLVRLRYYDSRWLHGDEWRQSFRDWLEDLDDRTTRSENDPACGCEPRYVIGADGLMDIDMGRVKLRDTYRIQEPRQVHLDTLNLSFNIDSETWPYYVELDVPRDHIPPYLLFLAAEESPVLRAACSPIEKPGFDGRLRDEPVEFWTPGTELEVAY